MTNPPHCASGRLSPQAASGNGRAVPLSDPASISLAPGEFVLYDLEVAVEGDPSAFVCRHRPGSRFLVQGENLVFPADGDDAPAFSLYALSALLPLLPAKQRPTAGDDWMTSDAVIACPDPHCGARFRIRRTGLRIFRRGDCTVTAVPA